MFKTMHFPLKSTKNGKCYFAELYFCQNYFCVFLFLCICPVISNWKKYEKLSFFEFLIAIHLTINISKIGVNDIKCFKLIEVGVLYA